MARPLRIEFPGAVYHVTSRGNARQPIYTTPADRHIFLDILQHVAERHHWLCHAFCLMSNHYHLLIETPEGNLSQGMRGLNGVYTQTYNRRHNRAGHLLQGRYNAMLVEKDNYLLEVARYIVLNPVRAKMVRSAIHYRWSSYRATAGFADPASFLTTVWILAQFSARKEQAYRLYRQFVKEGINKKEVVSRAAGSVLLGSEDFVRRCRQHTTGNLTEVPREQRFAGRPTLHTLFKESKQASRTERNRLICTTCLQHGYSMAKVARHLGLHYSTVSKIINTR